MRHCNTQFEIALYQPLSLTEAHFTFHGANHEALTLHPVRQAHEVGLTFRQNALGGKMIIGHQMKPRHEDHALVAKWQLSF